MKKIMMITLMMIATLTSCSTDDINTNCQCDVYVTVYELGVDDSVILPEYKYDSVEDEYCTLNGTTKSFLNAPLPDYEIQYPDIYEYPAFITFRYECK